MGIINIIFYMQFKLGCKTSSVLLETGIQLLQITAKDVANNWLLRVFNK
jgi:hypothetical protein